MGSLTNNVERSSADGLTFGELGAVSSKARGLLGGAKEGRRVARRVLDYISVPVGSPPRNANTAM